MPRREIKRRRGPSYRFDKTARHPPSGQLRGRERRLAGKEAERLYDEIFFFTDNKTLRLPDDELVAELKESNPEWFD